MFLVHPKRRMSKYKLKHLANYQALCEYEPIKLAIFGHYRPMINMQTTTKTAANFVQNSLHLVKV